MGLCHWESPVSSLSLPTMVSGDVALALTYEVCVRLGAQGEEVAEVGDKRPKDMPGFLRVLGWDLDSRGSCLE